MSFAQFIFPVLTIIFAIACFACWKTNKPLREKAKEVLKETQRQERAEAKRAFEKLAADKLKQDVYGLLDAAISNPRYQLEDTRYGSLTRGKSRWTALSRLIDQVSLLIDQKECNAALKDRVEKQSKLIRDLQLQQRDIQKALGLGQPVEK